MSSTPRSLLKVHEVKSAFGDSIVNVFTLRTNSQMDRIATAGIVAQVKNDIFPLQLLFENKGSNYAMNIHCLAVTVDLTVSSLRSSTLPLPTTRSCNFNSTVHSFQ